MSKKFKTNKLYTMLNHLEKVWKLSNKDSSQARSQLDYYIRNGYLTSAMKKEANRIIDSNWELIKPKRLEKRHYLYAISDGEFIKVGMSSCVDRRIKQLQTSSPKCLSKVWACYAGENDKEARSQEKKLHRAISRYSVKGEWFNSDCMRIIDGWRVRSRNAKKDEEAVIENDRLDAEFAAITG